MDNFPKASQLARLSLKIVSWTLLLASLGYVSLAGLVAVYTQSHSTHAADVVIVLGAKAHRNGQYNPCLQARVTKGVELVLQEQAPHMIVTGGIDFVDSKSEALAMKDMALALGLSEDQIIVEPKATSTYDNIVLSQHIMQTHNFESAIIVSEPFHLARAALVARKQGMEHQVAAASESPCWQKSGYLSSFFWREPAAILGYFLLGYL